MQTSVAVTPPEGATVILPFIQDSITYIQLIAHVWYSL